MNLATGVTDEILSPLGSITFGADTDGVPGSALLLLGNGFSTSQFAWDVQVPMNVQLPIVAAELQGLWVQIPWEYAPASREVHKILIRAQNNPFESLVNIGVSPSIEPHLATWTDPATGNIYAKAVHQDFQSLVTPASPAHPGEVVHVYLTGLGPLDHPLPTGAPGLSDPLAHPLTPLNCYLGGNPLRPLAILDVNYAVGMIGIYQADLSIPDTVAQTNTTLSCSSAGRAFTTTAALSIGSAP